MAVERKKLIASGFALVGAVSLVAAVLPAIKGQSPNVTFLGSGVIWFVLAVVVARGSKNRIR